MNIQVTGPKKYSNVKKVANYGARLVDNDHVDGHLSITYMDGVEEYTLAIFGVTSNADLDEEFGFRFVSHHDNIDNQKYYS